MKKIAFITGITGQDGSYLTELLLKKGYIVHGMIRRHSSLSTDRIDHLFNNSEIKDKTLFLHHGDMTDSSNLNRLIEHIQPTEIYNLAAQSHVAVSFEVPEYTAEVTGLGTLRLLDSIKSRGTNCRYYQASTSELYGGLPGTAPQNEATPFYPRSPYGAAKLYSYWVTVNYREAYGIYACNGILFNHESPRRGETFVTRKITRAVASILAGKQEKIYLGNLNAKRDWGFAGDYVEGMWLMLQQKKPGDYILASNETHTVREFVELAFRKVGILLRWEGEGIDEKGYDIESNKMLVEIDPKYFRPTEVECLLGQSQKAEKELGWVRKVCFDELVTMMIDHDMKEIAGIDMAEYRLKYKNESFLK